MSSGVPQELAARLLHAAGATVTGVDIDVTELQRSRAAPGNDLLTPFLDRVPPVAQVTSGRGLAGSPMAPLPGKRPRLDQV